MTTRKNRNHKHYVNNKSNIKRKNKKSRYSNKKKTFSKKNNKKIKLRKKTYKKLIKRGGYGKGTCPYVTPPDPWNASGYSYLYPVSKNGVAVGGVPVYSKQNGGNILQQITPQFMLNTGRVAANAGTNLINRYKGLKLEASPLPMYDNLTENDLRKMGL